MTNTATLEQKQFLRKQTLTIDKDNGVLNIDAKIKRKHINASCTLASLDPDYVDVRMIPKRFLWGMFIELCVTAFGITAGLILNDTVLLQLGLLASVLLFTMICFIPITRISEIHFYNKETMRPAIAVWYKGKQIQSDVQQFTAAIVAAITKPTVLKNENMTPENIFESAALITKDLYMYGVISHTELALLRQNIQKKARLSLNKRAGVIKLGNLIDISNVLKERERVS